MCIRDRRYPEAISVFKPDNLTDAKYENKEYLMNADDNTIRYTDGFLASLITLLQKTNSFSAMLYTSDHGCLLYTSTPIEGVQKVMLYGEQTEVINVKISTSKNIRASKPGYHPGRISGTGAGQDTERFGQFHLPSSLRG